MDWMTMEHRRGQGTTGRQIHLWKLKTAHPSRPGALRSPDKDEEAASPHPQPPPPPHYPLPFPQPPPQQTLGNEQGEVPAALFAAAQQLNEGTKLLRGPAARSLTSLTEKQAAKLPAKPTFSVQRSDDKRAPRQLETGCCASKTSVGPSKPTRDLKTGTLRKQLT